MKQLVLSAYPLSRAFREALELKVNCPLEPVLLQEIRRSSLIGTLRSLRDLAGIRLYVALEDSSSVAILPVLHMAAACTRVRHKFIVDHELRISQMRRIDATIGVLGLLCASVNGLARCAISIIRARRLLRTPRNTLQIVGRRMLYLNANLWFGVKAGGSVGHISGVINAFFREGYEVLFFSAGGRLMVNRRVTFRQLEPPRSFGMPWESNYYTFDDRVVTQVEPLAQTFSPSFIYQRLSLGNLSGVRLSRRLGVPLVLEYNGSEVWVARHWGQPLRLESAAILAEQTCLRHAHLIVTISDALRDELRERGVEDSRIVTYPNCIDPELFDPARFSCADRAALRARYSIERNATVVTFLGSFGPWHGVPVLAEAIRFMIEKQSAWLEQNKVCFVLIGDGVKMAEVRAILGLHAESRHVRLTGLVSQDMAPAYLAASDILSSPHVPNSDGSRFFGSPTKLFEYMAMGKGIVASNLDQIGDVLRNSLLADQLPKDLTSPTRALAVLCKPGSIEEHVQGLQFLVNNPTWRRQMGANARDEVLRRYTWSTHVRHVLNGLGQRNISNALSRSP